MRPNSPKNRPVLSLAKGASGLRRPSLKTSLLREARDAPDDADLWKRLASAAINEGDFALARRVAEKCGADRELLLAETAIISGEPTEALVHLKLIDTPAAKNLRAWALFCSGKRDKAREIWKASNTVEDQHLARLSSHESVIDAEVLIWGERLMNAGRRDVAAVASFLFAERYFRQENYPKALLWSRRAEWLTPFFLPLLRMTADCAWRTGNAETAVARWQVIVTRNPDDADAFERLGEAAQIEENTSGAIDYWSRALTIDPFRNHLRIRIGDIARNNGEDFEALTNYETAHRINPNDREALTRLAETSWATGEFPVALDAYLKLFAIGFTETDFEEQAEILGYLLAEDHLSGGESHKKESDKFFASAITKFPANLLLRLYYARCLLGTGEIDKARTMLAEILKADPLLPEAVFEMGNIFALEDKMEEALPYFERAAKLDGDPFYLKELGKCLLDLSRWKDAGKKFRRALATGTEDDEILLGLYAAFFYDGNYPGAENVLRRVLTMEPENLQASTYLAEVLMIRGEYEEAYQLMREVSRRAPEIDSKDYGNAPKAVVEPPGLVEWIMGFASLLAGHPRQAGRNFKKGLSIAPDLLDWPDKFSMTVIDHLESSTGINKSITAELIERLRDTLKNRSKEP